MKAASGFQETAPFRIGAAWDYDGEFIGTPLPAAEASIIPNIVALWSYQSYGIIYLKDASK